MRDVSTGATDATQVAPKFLNTLTLIQPGGSRFCPSLALTPEFSLWLRPYQNRISEKD